jgi:hypothetical protein
MAFGGGGERILSTMPLFALKVAVARLGLKEVLRPVVLVAFGSGSYH